MPRLVALRSQHEIPARRLAAVGASLTVATRSQSQSHNEPVSARRGFLSRSHAYLGCLSAAGRAESFTPPAEPSSDTE